MNNTPNMYTDKPEPMSEAEQALWTVALGYARNVFNAEGHVPAAMFSVKEATQEIGFAPLAGMTKAESSHWVSSISRLAPVCMVTEAWVTHYSTETHPELCKAAREGGPLLCAAPSQDPNREEVLCVNLHHKARRVQATAKIIRPVKGQVTLGEWRIFDNTTPGNVLTKHNLGDPNHRLT